MAAVRFERFDAALEYSTQAIKMLSADKSQAAAFGLALMAQAAAMRESLKIEPAIETYYQVIEVLLQVGNLVALGASGIALGRLFQLQGRLAEAADFYRDLLARMGPNASSRPWAFCRWGWGKFSTNKTTWNRRPRC